MSAPRHGSVLALVCDAGGIVKSILRDDIGGVGEEPVLCIGRPLLDSLQPGSHEKGARLLEELATRRSAGGWELVVMSAGRGVTMQFAGIVTDDEILLVATTLPGTDLVYEEIVGISAEQSQLLRAALKEQRLLSARSSEREADHVHELTQVNNDLVNLQRELTQKNRELARLDATKNELLGMAAHDLRNPLGVVMAYSKFLLSERVGPINEKQGAFLANIRTSSEFMLRLLEDLLDISQIESGKLRLDLARLDLRAQVERNVMLNAVLAEKKEIALHFECALEEAPVTADAAKIEQVLNNLVSNAVKFSPAGSAVSVVLAAAAGGYELRVADHGPGIPADELERLFTPFSRTSVKPTAGEKSTGLGLAIVQKIIAGHGGTVRVESEVGKGTTFQVMLPSEGPTVS